MTHNKIKNIESIRIVLFYTTIASVFVLAEKYMQTSVNNFQFSSLFEILNTWGLIIFSCFIIFYFCTREIKRKNNLITKLNNHEQRYLTLFNNANDAILLIKDNTILESNNKAFELLKRNKFQIINTSIFSLSYKDQIDDASLKDKYEELIEQLKFTNSLSANWSFILPDGKIIDTEITFIKNEIAGERLVQLIIKDNSKHITDQIQIAESERKYQEIVENANTCIIKFDLEGKLTYVNEYTEKLYGYRSDEIYGKYIFEVFSLNYTKRNTNGNKPDPRKMMHRILREINTEPTKENWNYTCSGKKIYMNWTSKPIYDEQENLIGVLSIGIDQTEHKIMFDRLTNNENKFKSVFNGITEGITIISLDGNILEQNAKALEFLGFNKADIGEHASTKSLVRSLITDFDSLVKIVENKGEVTFVVDLVSAQNEKITSEINAKFAEYNGKKVILAVSRDINERKIQQQKIFNTAVEAEEIERSRVSKELHDSVSPLLSVAKLYAQTLKDANNKTLQNKIISKIESTINESIQSIYEISNNLSPHILENFGFIEAINSFIDRIPKNNIIFEVKNNINERLDKTIETTLYRVTTELINNTIKHSKASEIFISFHKNKAINLEYIDNGIGFNTNEILENSKGMGIFNMTNRIKSINGKINIESFENKGTKVKVSIPQ